MSKTADHTCLANITSKLDIGKSLLFREEDSGTERNIVHRININMYLQTIVYPLVNPIDDI